MEMDRAKARRYSAANREKERARSAAWRAANPEKMTAAVKSWRARNPERQREMAKARRAALAGAEVHTITDRDWRRLCARYGDRCAYCGKAGALTKDHRVPITRGGRHAIGNLLPACRSCNSSKHSLCITEWRAGRPRRKRPALV